MTLLRIAQDGRLEQAYTVADKRELLERLQANDALIAAWTGSYRTDTFWVDDRDAVREALE